MSLTVHYYIMPENIRGHKILAAAALAGVKAEGKMVPAMCGDENWRKNCSPTGGSPCLETPEGYIFESNAILRYIARLDKSGNLYGKTNYENAMVDSWLDTSATEIDPLFVPIFNFVFAQVPFPDCFQASCEAVFKAIEPWLENRTYLVGERLTIADIAIAFGIKFLYRLSNCGEALYEKFPNVARHFETVMAVPEVEAVHAAVGGEGKAKRSA